MPIRLRTLMALLLAAGAYYLLARLGLMPTPRNTRRRTCPPAPPVSPHPSATRTALLHSHRSPYGLPTVLDGAETVAVRPYLLVGELHALEAAA